MFYNVDPTKLCVKCISNPRLSLIHFISCFCKRKLVLLTVLTKWWTGLSRFHGTRIWQDYFVFCFQTTNFSFLTNNFGFYGFHRNYKVSRQINAAVRSFVIEEKDNSEIFPTFCIFQSDDWRFVLNLSFTIFLVLKRPLKIGRTETRRSWTVETSCKIWLEFLGVHCFNT